jgi:hypothetical protein
MTYHGHVENGLIVLDDSVALPEGAAVTVELRDATRSQSGQELAHSDAHGGLMRFAGIAKDLPSDASRNLDHYLYGHPKQ